VSAGPGPTKGRKPVYLHPGQVFVSAEAASVTTILGSCVAVCLWDPARGLGGVNHYLLPHRSGGATSSRFGDVSLGQLVDRLVALGGVLSRLRAKVFGGAWVTRVSPPTEGHLGQQNVEVARRLLEREGIPVVAEDTGGDHGRRLVFHTDDGSAWVRRI
jgi:chemotaxis protein CheD